MSTAKFLQAKPIVDFPAVEREIAELWRAQNTFEKSLENRKGRPQFTFYEGPPTANGLPHNGHVLTRVFKDVFLRYQTMRGKYVPRKAGWDTHGLPVEVEVEKELGIHGKEAIEEYGVEKFIARCIESVFRYTNEWERMTEKVGFWVDLDDAYVTYHRSFVESVWWALSELFKKGLLYKGHKIVWWWPQGGTALSAGEVGQGYKTVEDPSVYVKMPLVDEPGVSLLVWTTTPWTLPSNQYVAVRPEYDYVQVKDEEHGSLIIAAALRETIAGKLGRELPIERELKGDELLGKYYVPPFDYFYPQYKNLEAVTPEGDKVKALWRVLAADFVELDSGTGLVHEAPAFGEVDYDLHRNTIAEYTNTDEIPLLCPIGPDGKFDATVADMQGKFVKDADRELIHKLRESGVLVLRENYRHEYPFCWRADDDPLIQFARPAWFIKTTARNKEVLANNAKIHWLPEHIGTGRFGDFLRNNVDWALSRERYWGTPLNIWINDETGNMQAPASVDEILAKNPNAFDHWHAAKKENPDLNDHLIVHKPWIDDVTWTEPGEPGVYRRVSEVIDCWFDSGCMPFAQWGFPHKNQEKFKASFPADYITEAIDQTRGWFYSQLMISTLVFDEECQKRVGLDPVRPYPHPFRTCIVLGHVTDPDGKKESKSKGNYTPPDAVMEKVAQEFAVVEADQCGVTIKPGQAVIAREDLEALDLKPGDMMTTRCAANPDKPIELAMQPGKKMPRRVIVLAPEDREKTGAQVNSKGVAIKPNEVMWLPPSERILVESSTSAAPGADAFRWLFLAGTPPWSQKRHSLGLVRTIQKEFPLKLRNVYAFFTIYANIDGYDPAVQKGRPVSDRTVLDRWILSELALTTQAVRENMDAFRAYEAAQALNNFVDGLSNWYVRRSRARYWKSEMDADKTDAYATLYESLVVIAKLAGPFTPFLAEEIYQNLVRRPFPDAPESVHLCDLPQEDEATIDRTLSEEMAAVRNVVSLGLRVRTEHKLKVRQPLHKAEVVMNDAELQQRLTPYLDLISEELNVHETVLTPSDEAHVQYVCRPNFRKLGPRLGQKMKSAKQAFSQADAAALRAALLDKGAASIEIEGEAIALDPEDVEVLVEAEGGYAAAGDRTTVVALDTEIDQQLLDEGLYREILRRVQDLRKDLDVEYTERVTVCICGSDRVENVLTQHRDSLAAEALIGDLRIGGPCLDTCEVRELELDGETVRIELARSGQ
ncbi:MAG: isoleucine--tRNA ligase [Bryobacterales bacterium]|nr:isoleucine--tRNA ligase [Acidobacteriota bacterium]MCB9385280.1 isoleucine--tRNA ligase [Bryobacterales bacterium]